MLTVEEHERLTDVLRLALAVRRPCDGLEMVARVMFIACEQIMTDRVTDGAPNVLVESGT